MSSSQRVVFLSLPLILCTGCNAAFWGNVGVLGVSVGIFLGTVFLNRGNADASTRGTRGSAETTSRR